MAAPKTLIPKIQNSPYFIKNNGRQFSQVLFKPGYPLQSAELITLQNIVNEQIRKFGNHIFKEEGSIVSSDVGLSFNENTPNCMLYSLTKKATGIDAGNTLVFKNQATNVELFRGETIGVKDAFIEDGQVYPDMIGMKKTEQFSYGFPGTVVDVFRDDFGVETKVATLSSNDGRLGRYCSIGDTIFYMSGYFVQIQPENFIYWVDESKKLDVEVGVELVWEIVDISHEIYGQALFDPAENAYNENSPGADRLLLTLKLAKHELGYVQEETDWKFLPLLKFENNRLIYRLKYPTYSVLGETLARRTYEINGNFVVDDFKLNISSDAILPGEHTVSNYTVQNSEETYWKIAGLNTEYLKLTEGNYLMFGEDDENYRRLLKIVDITDDFNMTVSDIHYDDFYETNTEKFNIANYGSGGRTLVLRDESKLNYILYEGLAYVQGYRFEKEFITQLIDDKARNTQSKSLTTKPNEHYFELEYDRNDFIPNDYIHTEHHLLFNQLEKVDLHCTKNKEFFTLDIQQAAGFNPLWSLQSPGDTLQIDGALFLNIDGSTRYQILKYTKNQADGLPQDNSDHNMLLNGSATPLLYNLNKIERYVETPYQNHSPSNYIALSSSLNKAAITDASNNIVTFTQMGGSDYNTLGYKVNDLIVVEDASGSYVYGIIDNIPVGTPTTMTVKTYVTNITNGNDYNLIRPAESVYYNRQYKSTKIGEIRATSVSSSHPERFHYSHYNLNSSVKTIPVFSVDLTNDSFSSLSLDVSFADEVYTGMKIYDGYQEFVIESYDGKTQTFKLSGVTPDNPITFSQSNQLYIVADFNNVRSIVKSSYLNGKEFKGNIRRTSIDTPISRTPDGTQQKFKKLIDSLEGEVKSVTVDDYSIFFQKVLNTTGANQQDFNFNISGGNFQSTYSIGTDKTRVYAGNDILDPNNTSTILYHQGENIPLDSADITSNDFNIKLTKGINIGDKIIVHAEIPIDINTSPLRSKNLKMTDTSTNVDAFNAKVLTNGTYIGVENDLTTPDGRIHANGSFELKYSDVYRIKKIEIAPGKTVSNATNAHYVDMTSYFTLDTGQRDTFYDHGRIVLKPYLQLPPIASATPNYAIRVIYEYFEPGAGHYFTVNSYTDIHYRFIPTYVDPKNQKFPLRNVLDFRPVRQPIGHPSNLEYDQEQNIISDIDVDFEYYKNENKIISIDGNGSSELEMNYKNVIDYKETEYNIKLYDVKIPAYTFDFKDVEYKMIDNKNYTMKDISKLQKRIENLEDIAQLNSLELQAIQTKLVNSDGDPRYKNGLLVDMFAGYTVADVSEDGFSASIDLNTMKMYPAFRSENALLHVPTRLSSNFPTIKKNIAYLPIQSHLVVGDNWDASMAVISAQLSHVNGKFTLYPFSDIWYSQEKGALPLRNEDNQYKNWNELLAYAHGTQWNDWEQFIYGVETDEKDIPLQNATLSQKTGSMVNNKNNIEKIVGNRKINKTLNYFVREKRVGFVFENIQPSGANDVYEIRINGKRPTTLEGNRIEFEHTGNISVDYFKSIYQGYEISSDVIGGTARGTIRHIEHVNGKIFYLYVTNMSPYMFDASKLINELNGNVKSVHTYTPLFKPDAEKNILCGDFTIEGNSIPYDTVFDVQLHNITQNRIEGSSKFYAKGLIETKSSHCHSIRPVTKKMYLDQDTDTPYIEDRTYVTNATTRIPTPLHQPFVLPRSQFISKIDIQVDQSTVGTESSFIVAIQPLVNSNLSPSLVLPFSEQVVRVPANYAGTITVNFDVPVFITANKDYAFTFRGTSYDNHTSIALSSQPTDSVFFENCFAASDLTQAIQKLGYLVKMKIYAAQFDTTSTKEMMLKIYDPNFAMFADRSCLNMNTLFLNGTDIKYFWKARNWDSPMKDVYYTQTPANKTEIHEKRKAITLSDYELKVQMKSSDPYITPMIDLERASLTTIQHGINNGALTADKISGNGTRTGGFIDPLRITLTEIDPANVYTPISSFEFDSVGNVSNFYSDPNMLVYNNRVNIGVEKWDAGNSVFKVDSTATSNYYSSTKSYKITGDDYEIESLSIIEETDSTLFGNPEYRYFSPIVTLADDFEAMQLYVQMDAILKTSGEIFVYYREIESTKTLDEIREKPYRRMFLNTHVSDKYSNNDRSRTLEFETQRLISEPRFKYFQVKVCFTSLNFVEVPIIENIRILALDN